METGGGLRLPASFLGIGTLRSGMHKPAQYVKPRTQEFYLVMVKVRPMNEGDPNTEVVAGKLRFRDAETMSGQIPGSWVQKVIATKP